MDMHGVFAPPNKLQTYVSKKVRLSLINEKYYVGVLYKTCLAYYKDVYELKISLNYNVMRYMTYSLS